MVFHLSPIRLASKYLFSKVSGSVDITKQDKRTFKDIFKDRQIVEIFVCKENKSTTTLNSIRKSISKEPDPSLHLLLGLCGQEEEPRYFPFAGKVWIIQWNVQFITFHLKEKRLLRVDMTKDEEDIPEYQKLCHIQRAEVMILTIVTVWLFLVNFLVINCHGNTRNKDK